MSSKLRQYRIKLSQLKGIELDENPTFKSKRAFLQSDLCDKIKHGGVSGLLTVMYGGDYKNFFDFSNYEDLRKNLDICTEPELLNEFAT